MTTPLASILNQNKLTGTNFVEWKRNLYIVLTAEDYLTALEDECPELPAANLPSEEESRAYNAWQKADNVDRVTYWALCPVCCNHRTSRLPQAMRSWRTSKKCLGIRTVHLDRYHEDAHECAHARRNSSKGSCP